MIISGMFLTIPLIAASVYSVKGGDFMKSFTDKVSGGIKSYTGSKTLGWTGSKANKYIANTRIGNSSFGRLINDNTFKKLADAKFGGGSNYADYQKRDADITKKGKQIKDRVSFEANIEEYSEDDRIIKDYEEKMREQDSIMKKTPDTSDPVYINAKAEKDRLETERDAYAQKPEVRERSQAVKDYVDGMSNDETKELKKIFERNPALAQHLSDSKLATMAKDAELEDTTGKIYDERTKRLKAAITAAKDNGNWDNVRAEMKNLSAVAINKLGIGEKMTLAENVGDALNVKMYEEITKDMSIGNKREFDSAWSEFFISNPTLVAKIKPEAVSKLNDKALTNDDVIDNLTAGHLAKISTAEKDKSVYEKIKDVIIAKNKPSIREYLNKGAAAEFWDPIEPVTTRSTTTSGTTASPSPRPRPRPIERRPGVR